MLVGQHAREIIRFAHHRRERRAYQRRGSFIGNRDEPRPQHLERDCVEFYFWHRVFSCVYSGLMPAVLTTAAQRVSSSAINLRKAFCDIGAGSSAPDANFSFTSGSAITCTNAACSLSSTGLGVPPMLAMPYQLTTTRSLTPCSPNVGASGSDEIRFSVATASALMRPDLISPIAGGADVKVVWICPAMTSVNARPTPLYGTCVSLTPVCI